MFHGYGVTMWDFFAESRLKLLLTTLCAVATFTQRTDVGSPLAGFHSTGTADILGIYAAQSVVFAGEQSAASLSALCAVGIGRTRATDAPRYSRHEWRWYAPFPPTAITIVLALRIDTHSGILGLSTATTRPHTESIRLFIAIAV